LPKKLQHTARPSGRRNISKANPKLGRFYAYGHPNLAGLVRARSPPPARPVEASGREPPVARALLEKQRYNCYGRVCFERIMLPLKPWEEVLFNNQHLSGKVTESLLNIRALGTSFDETKDAAQWSTSPLKSLIDYVFAEGNEADYALAFILLEGKRTPRLYMLHALCAWAERQTDQGQGVQCDWQSALLKETSYWRRKDEADRQVAEENTQSHLPQTMTREEAAIVFRDWQAYAEIHDKLLQLFGRSIPQSFLPYPPEVLKKAMDIVASVYSNVGDDTTYSMIQDATSTLLCYKDDEEAISNIVDGIRLKRAEFRKIFISKLKRSRDNWAKIKGYQPRGNLG